MDKILHDPIPLILGQNCRILYLESCTVLSMNHRGPSHLLNPGILTSANLSQGYPRLPLPQTGPQDVKSCSQACKPNGSNNDSNNDNKSHKKSSNLSITVINITITTIVIIVVIVISIILIILSRVNT